MYLYDAPGAEVRLHDQHFVFAKSLRYIGDFESFIRVNIGYEGVQEDVEHLFGGRKSAPKVLGSRASMKFLWSVDHTFTAPVLNGNLVRTTGDAAETDANNVRPE